MVFAEFDFLDRCRRVDREEHLDHSVQPVGASLKEEVRNAGGDRSAQHRQICDSLGIREVVETAMEALESDLSQIHSRISSLSYLMIHEKNFASLGFELMKFAWQGVLRNGPNLLGDENLGSIFMPVQLTFIANFSVEVDREKCCVKTGKCHGVEGRMGPGVFRHYTPMQEYPRKEFNWADVDRAFF